jgi:hypothetical protein
MLIYATFLTVQKSSLGPMVMLLLPKLKHRNSEAGEFLLKSINLERSELERYGRIERSYEF